MAALCNTRSSLTISLIGKTGIKSNLQRQKRTMPPKNEIYTDDQHQRSVTNAIFCEWNQPRGSNFRAALLFVF